MVAAVTAAIFDLFETLITESHTRPAGVSSYASALGCDRDAFRDLWKARRHSVMIGRLWFRQALGEITTTLGRPADDEVLRAISDERVRIKAEAFARIEPEILTLIDHLRGRNIRLGVVSNCCAEDVAAWPTCALATRFDCAIFSYDIGLAKPDPGIYREALRRLDANGSDASEAWYIGDGQDDELRGAAEAGLRAWQAQWFLKRWPHFRSEAPGESGRGINRPATLVRVLRA